MYNDTNGPSPDETKPRDCYPAEVGSHRKYTILRTALRGENSVLPQESTCSQAISTLQLVSRLAFHDQGQHQAYCIANSAVASMSAEAAAGNWGRCENTADSSSH